MIPIFEQGGGRGHGYMLDRFIERFDQVCKEHVQAGRAKAFAFIFYDFTNDAMRRILKNQGVFAQLDRLSGKELSIFYLHSGTPQAVEHFNNVFTRQLELPEEVSPPCVVFFKFHKDKLTDISVAELDSRDLVHSFKELYGVIEEYLETATAHPRYVRWVKSSAKFIAVEAVKEAIKYGLGLH